MKKLFLLAVAAICALGIKAQTMQMSVWSNNEVLLTETIDAIDSINFVVAPAESIGFKDRQVVMDALDTLNIADLMVLRGVTIGDITFASTNSKVVAVESGQLVAKEYGISTIVATYGSMEARMFVSVESEFRMYIEDVFNITGVGTTATGVIEKGKVRLNQPLEIINRADSLPQKSFVVTDIRMFMTQVTEAAEGDNVGFVLSGVEKTDIARGSTIIAKNNRTNFITTKVEGTVYVRTRDEGGRHTPYFITYKPYLYVGTSESVCSVIDLGLDSGGDPVEMCMPGQTYTNQVVELAAGTKIVTYIGQKLYYREGGKIVAEFTVTKIY